VFALQHNNGFDFVFRFLFSESTRLTSVGGEKALAAMIGTLADSLETEYGTLVARLFRVFKSQPNSEFYMFTILICRFI
jgi:hypothetical protein